MTGCVPRRRRMAACLLLAAAGAGAEPFSRPAEIAPPGYAGPDVELLGSVELGARAPDGHRVSGLSGLAWDADEQVLYAVSDEGYLLHLRPAFDGDRLSGVEHLATYTLRDDRGRPLAGRRRDAEDLAIRHSTNGTAGDTELLVAFERAPRIARYAPDGTLLDTLDLPLPLAGVGNYAAPNRSLESVAEHPVFGLLTMPEASLDDDPPGTVSLFALDGRRWSYTTADDAASAPTALDVLPDGRLVALERAFVSLLWPLVITLRITDPGDEPGLEVATLARLDTSEGWGLDNFEGLAWHRCDRFFVVSDDNASSYQRTLLLYLRLPALAVP